MEFRKIQPALHAKHHLADDRHMMPAFTVDGHYSLAAHGEIVFGHVLFKFYEDGNEPCRQLWIERNHSS